MAWRIHLPSSINQQSFAGHRGFLVDGLHSGKEGKNSNSSHFETRTRCKTRYDWSCRKGQGEAPGACTPYMGAWPCCYLLVLNLGSPGLTDSHLHLVLRAGACKAKVVCKLLQLSRDHLRHPNVTSNYASVTALSPNDSPSVNDM